MRLCGAKRLGEPNLNLTRNCCGLMVSLNRSLINGSPRPNPSVDKYPLLSLLGVCHIMMSVAS